MLCRVGVRRVDRAPLKRHEADEEEAAEAQAAEAAEAHGGPPLVWRVRHRGRRAATAGLLPGFGTVDIHSNVDPHYIRYVTEHLGMGVPILPQ